MSVVEFVPVQRIDSPCVNICRIDRKGLCEGCRRTRDEIAAWTRLTPDQRRAIMAELKTR